MRKNNKKRQAQRRANNQKPAAAQPNHIDAAATESATVPVEAKTESVTANLENSVKPAESKIVETKPVETKLTESKPVETKLTETKPVETKLTESKPVETKLTETKPVETKLAESKPAETKLTETKPVETKLTESKPAETKLTETKPVETKLAESKPVETKLTETKSTDSKAEEQAESTPVKKTAASKAAKADETKTAAKKTTRTRKTAAKTTVEEPAKKTTTRKRTTKAADTTKTTKTTTRRSSAKKPAVDEGAEFMNRFNSRLDEFKWLYMELYNDERLFDELNYNLNQIYQFRKAELKQLDRQREENPNWYRQGKLLGMQMYTDLFAKDLAGVAGKLDYLEELHVNALHLLPLLKTPATNNDDGFTISDFRAVREDLGTTEQLEQLADACHEKGISLCLDFDVNHTSSEHEWAQRAMQGDPEYAGRYISHWDLNYRNPVVFNEMAYNLLYLANLGVDAFQLHDLNLLDTRSHSFPKVHSIVRMLRIICEIVCPGVLLECTTGLIPQDAQAFLGTSEKPECHMLYNTLVTSSVWNAIATRDTRLLKGELDNLPQGATYINSLRNYDPLHWEMSDDPLSWLGFDPYLHREFLFSFFDGSYADSFARGAQYHLYEDDGSCGTTASFCGIEKALKEKNEEELALAIERDLLLHTLLFTLPGVPVLYSGDEIGQQNDYSDSKDPRSLHRAPFDWTAAEKRKDTDTVEGKIFQKLRALEEIRQKYAAIFADDNAYRTVETGEISLLMLMRGEKGNGKLTAVFNFCEQERTVTVEPDNYTDLLTGKKSKGGELTLAPYQAVWLYQK